MPGVCLQLAHLSHGLFSQPVVNRINLVDCVLPVEFLHRVDWVKLLNWFDRLVWQHLLDRVIPQRLQCSQWHELSCPDVLAGR